MRLIDADKTIGHIKTRLLETALNNCTAVCDVSYIYQDCADNRIETWVDEMPTVEPIKHGHWRERDFGLICSECNHYTETMYDEPFNNEFGKGWALKRPYYCGYCGAKMDEIEERLTMPKADGSTIPKSYMDEVTNET